MNWFGSVPRSGGKVFEQTGVVSYEGNSCRCRRVVVQLDRPTRDGEREIALLTNLPETDASSVLVAQLYGKLGSVETLFQVATEIFHCEIKTLGYQASCSIFFLYGLGRLQSVFNSQGSSCALFMVGTAEKNCPITIWGKNSTPLIRE